MIDDSGFRKELNPLLQALPNSHSKACIIAENIRDEVGTFTLKLQTEIQEKICGKLILLKIDIATRLDKATLGVNISK